MIAAVDVSELSYAYGKTDVLRDVTLSVPQGAIYALLGPNGAGKTTLMQLIMGLRRAGTGQVALLGVDSRALRPEHRARIGYVAEGQALPARMRLRELEAYLAPLYPTWDPSHAAQLRDRFGLDPERRVGTLSRGEHMKAALLCALAPRPALLLMDEPFTGLDVVVKDEIVRGMLESASSDGWTVVISSHDIAELEVLADWAGFLANGRMVVSEPMEQLRERYKRVTIIGDNAATLKPDSPSDRWLTVNRAARRLSFVTPNAGAEHGARLRARYPGAELVTVEELSLREVFVALASENPAGRTLEGRP